MFNWQHYFGYALSLDTHLCVKVSHTSQYRYIRHCFRLISRLGDGLFWGMLMLTICLTQGQSGVYACLHMLCVGFTGTLLYKLIKHHTSRPRPFQVRQDVLLSGTPLDYFSFPSGHTLHAVAFGLVALQHYPALWPIVMPFIVLVGISRVVLGLHYPSDVLAGAGLGYLLVTVYQPYF